ncbi:MAG TPA: response regulator [Verrucomicrobiae bacterium]
MSAPGTVYVVDDDAGMRKALARLTQAAGLRSRTFASAAEFLDQESLESPACIVLDIHMPGLSGLDLQAELAKRNLQTPIVFITGYGDVPSSVRAMKAGAVDFLTKPFNNRNLIEVMRNAVRKDASRQAGAAEREAIQRRLGTLTPREMEVLKLVLRGLLNKQIAAELGASEQTIKVHRGRVMDKMQMQSVAELVQAAVKVGLVTA